MNTVGNTVYETCIEEHGMLNWQPMTDEDWEWVNYGTLPKNS